MRALNLFIYLTIFCISSVQVLGLLVGEECSAHSECPAQTRCVPNNCGEPGHPPSNRCTCNVGFYQTPDNSTCYTVVDLNEACNDLTLQCRQGSYCSASKCKCLPDYVPSKPLNKGQQRCKPKLSAPPKNNPTFWSVFDEPCNEKTMCFDQFGHLECRFGRCRCKDGYRPRERQEAIMNAVQLLADCIPDTFEISETGFC